MGEYCVLATTEFPVQQQNGTVLELAAQRSQALLSFDAGGFSVCASSHQIGSNTRPSLEMGTHFQVLVVVESLTFDVISF